MTLHPPPATEPNARYELRFQSLFHTGRGVSFPCDRQGAVDLETMNERAREAFLRAQEGVGREYASPSIRLG